MTGTYDRVVGSCWACGGQLRVSQIVKLLDGSGALRKLHRGVCADRFAVQNSPTVEGRSSDDEREGVEDGNR